MHNNQHITQRLKKLRNQYNITNTELAEYLQLTPKETQKLETGKKQLTVSIIDKLCKLYGCSEEYILCQNNFYDPHQFIHNKNELKDLGAIASMNTIISNIQFLDKAYKDFKTNLIKELEK
jgi:transcriptional regulator with XRE-family HTH domain